VATRPFILERFTHSLFWYPQIDYFPSGGVVARLFLAFPGLRDGRYSSPSAFHEGGPRNSAGSFNKGYIVDEGPPQLGES